MQMSAPYEIEPELFARLPEPLHYKGPPTAWTQRTRPGENIHSFLEGACCDSAGNLWLVDIPNGRILRVDPKGQWSVVHAYDGHPHCLAHLPDGAVVIADRSRGLLRFDPAAGSLSVLCGSVNSENFRALSDVTVAPGGDLWFCDPGRSSVSDPTGRLLRLRSGKTEPDLVLANLPYPNGVAVSRDGRFVFVSLTRLNAIWRLLADAPDPVYPMVSTYQHLNGGAGPDGMAIDSLGRLAVAHAQAGRAWLYDAIGDPLARIRTPGGMWTTTVAFSPDERWLYVVDAQTASVYRADLSVLPR